MNNSSYAVLSGTDAGVRSFMQRVYGWMSLGLLVTGACAAYMTSDPRMILNLIHTPFLFWGLLLTELGLVYFLSSRIGTMEASTAKFAFLFYAALTGITMSVIFLTYTRESIAGTFFITAGTFAIMSGYGYLTKTDLSTIGNLCFMALIGIILASLANYWMQSAALSWAISYLSILIFTGLTAYDTQKIKSLYQAGGDDVDTKQAISGALSLYLDFINLFMSLLRVMGRRRD